MRLLGAALVLTLAVFSLSYGTMTVQAEEEAVQATAETDESKADFKKRLKLAESMHELRSTRDQVHAAIDQVAMSQPESEREAFKTAMRNILNYKAIERISIDAMAETFTAEELQAMYEYHSKPEAKSAAGKDQEYAQKVYPEIIRMLDQAMMRLRTGQQ